MLCIKNILFPHGFHVKSSLLLEILSVFLYFVVAGFLKKKAGLVLKLWLRDVI